MLCSLETIGVIIIPCSISVMSNSSLLYKWVFNIQYSWWCHQKMKNKPYQYIIKNSMIYIYNQYTKYCNLEINRCTTVMGRAFCRHVTRYFPESEIHLPYVGQPCISIRQTKTLSFRAESFSLISILVGWNKYKQSERINQTKIIYKFIIYKLETASINLLFKKSKLDLGIFPDE